ncbi:xylose isomerase-like protein [Lophiotrema nucula]|uniref:Apurinic-apyrimidinic endonuclease 1 n=1 Tax=Lophiotrema nucula TaxID=690887 RepID=A0A6A5YN54_9PLEO|nr:xylose isomerase-like protein [Lophiotrema nucula]
MLRLSLSLYTTVPTGRIASIRSFLSSLPSFSPRSSSSSIAPRDQLALYHGHQRFRQLRTGLKALHPSEATYASPTACQAAITRTRSVRTFIQPPHSVRTLTTSTQSPIPTRSLSQMAPLLSAGSSGSLSPPPDEINEAMLAEDAEAGLSKLNGAGKKRKADTVTKTTKSTKRTKKSIVEDNGTATNETDGVEATPKKGRKKTVKVQEEVIDEEVKVEAAEGEDGQVEVKVKRKRATKKKEAEAPLEQRTVGSKLRIGAHVSGAGGVHNSITNLLHIGANAFALFLKSQRKWENPPLDPNHAKLFMDGCKQHGIQPGECCVPHGSYLVNLAHPDEARKKQAYDSFFDDLTRCHKLGIKYYNFHPGNVAATTRDEGTKLIAAHINNAHKDPATGGVMPLLETMATLGNTIGGTFEDIAQIIEHVEDKTRIGVCLDTCHVFAAGYDLRTPEAYNATIAKFDEVVGLKYLKALHVNDSKAPFGSNRDLHAQIGTGYLGLRSFHNIVNDQRLHGLPMVLETPIDVKGADGKKVEDKSIWAREIKMLEKLVGMNMDTDEFKDLDAKLHEAGASERERVGDQVRRKEEKATKTPKKRGKKAKKVESEDEEDVDGE